jgi:hypothetical protein
MAKKAAQLNELAVAACTNPKCMVHRVTVTAYPSIPLKLCCPACGEALGDAVRLDHATLTQQGWGMTIFQSPTARRSRRAGRK